MSITDWHGHKGVKSSNTIICHIYNINRLYTYIHVLVLGVHMWVVDVFFLHMSAYYPLISTCTVHNMRQISISYMYGRGRVVVVTCHTSQLVCE